MRTMPETATVLEPNIATVAQRDRGRLVACPAMLDDARDLVLDANRVTVCREAGTCWLKTVDPNSRLRVTPDGRLWVYREIGNGRFARMHEIEDAWEMMTPLANAVADCDLHGHAWSPDQIVGPEARLSLEWAWCLICGVERVVSPDGSGELMWPADARLIHVVTGGLLPKLHGPLSGGQERERSRNGSRQKRAERKVQQAIRRSGQ
jgi:hypothetical protein